MSLTPFLTICLLFFSCTSGDDIKPNKDAPDLDFTKPL
jgi:hypothetical protein